MKTKRIPRELPPRPLPLDPRWEERRLFSDAELEQIRDHAYRTAAEQGKPERSDTPWR